MTIKLNDVVTVCFPGSQEVTGPVVGLDEGDNWLIMDLGGRHDHVKIEWLVGEIRGVKCGNHSNAQYHASVAAVRNCYATHFSERRIRQAGSVRGWWDLPIAATMWGADRCCDTVAIAQVPHDELCSTRGVQ